MARLTVRHRRDLVLVVTERQWHGVDGAVFLRQRGGRHGSVQRHQCPHRRHGGNIGRVGGGRWGYHITLGLPVVSIALGLFLALTVRHTPRTRLNS
jgi:hypothetical protein